MPTTQIRNIPVSLRRRLKTRAAEAGMSLSAYLMNEFRKLAETPTIEEFNKMVKRRTRETNTLAPTNAPRLGHNSDDT